MEHTQLTEPLREHIRTALKHYAGFYAALASEDVPLAESQIDSIVSLDKEIKETETGEDFEAYYQRRSQLMRIFHSELIKTLEGQLHEDILDKAQTLAKRLEITKEP